MVPMLTPASMLELHQTHQLLLCCKRGGAPCGTAEIASPSVEGVENDAVLATMGLVDENWVVVLLRDEDGALSWKQETASAPVLNVE